MTYKFNGQEYQLPTQLKEITLKQRIDYDIQYGKELDAQKQLLDEMPESSDKTIELFLWEADCACKTFSFFTGIALDAVRSSIEVRQLINVYKVHLAILLEEEYQIQLEDTYLFKGQQWVIVTPTGELSGDDMTFKDFLTSKSVIKDLAALGDGYWDRLPALCSVYLRKRGETTEEVLQQTEQRQALMMDLPLDIALTVGMFLKETMTYYLRSMQDFKQIDQ